MLIEKGWTILNGIWGEQQLAEIVSLINYYNTAENKKFLQLPRKLFKSALIKPLVSLIQEETRQYKEYSKLKLEKIWFVHTLNENSRAGVLPYVPHFDKRRYLKLMIYLTNVSALDGPFTTASFPASKNEYKRLRLDKSSAEENIVEEKLKYNKITLKAGDGIIFDTNCPHFASPVDVDGERKILRLDFQKMEWNDHLDSFKRRILKRMIA